METVTQYFRLEFINRIDEVVVFHPLAKEQIRAIAGIQINQLRKRLEGKGFGLAVSEAALERLGEAGFDPVYGARPLKRAIQQQLENPIALAILGGKFGDGDVISVDVAGSDFVFEKAE
jgi:ATP-dependent Clp protease ATP-binding subunit ClpB